MTLRDILQKMVDDKNLANRTFCVLITHHSRAFAKRVYNVENRVPVNFS